MPLTGLSNEFRLSDPRPKDHSLLVNNQEINNFRVFGEFYCFRGNGLDDCLTPQVLGIC